MDQTRLKGAKIAAGQLGISAEQYLQNINSGLKWCFRCKSFISRDLFCNSADKSDGKHSQCKSCEGVSRRRRYKPISPEERPTRGEDGVQIPRNGDKRQARQRVNNEVKKGKLPRAQTIPCTDCKHIGSNRIHEYDHYLGYEVVNHLKVQVVCNPCHRQRERQRRKQQQPNEAHPNHRETTASDTSKIC